MTKHQFVQLLHNPNYKDMLVIYNRHKINDKRDSFFNQVSNPEKNSIHFNMMVNEIRKIFGKLERNNGFSNESSVKSSPIQLRELKPVIQKPQNPAETKVITKTEKVIQRPKIDKNPHINYDVLPENLKKLYDENGKLEAEIKSRHAMMSALPPDAEFNDKRKELVNEIDKLETKQGSNWDVIDDWYNNPDNKVEQKKVDETCVPDKSNPVECSKYIERANRYIQRYHKTQKPKQMEKLVKYRIGLKELGIDAK